MIHVSYAHIRYSLRIYFVQKELVYEACYMLVPGSRRHCHAKARDRIDQDEELLKFKLCATLC